MLKPTLSNSNPHPRDKNLVFDEPAHKYTITTDPDSKYTSVTTWNHSHFPKFDADAIIGNMMRGKGWKPGHKYWGQTADEIKASWTNNGSTAGTDLHYNIECFMNMEATRDDGKTTHKDLLEYYHNHGASVVQNTSPEWVYFLQYIAAFPDFKPYRTEWMIYYEELKLAGSIDMVYENPDGTLMIYDWKRSKEIVKASKWNKYALTECIDSMPDTNYWHYSLQLNVYKAILEAKYGKTVTDLFLVRLHPENNPKNTYELIRVPDLSAVIAQLFEERRQKIVLGQLDETEPKH